MLYPNDAEVGCNSCSLPPLRHLYPSILRNDMTLRSVLSCTHPCRFIGAYDAISCILAERAGFEAIWASGLCISAVNGLPDANILSFDVLVSVLRNMRSATTLPILADCDTGYGDFHNAIHVTRELGKAGISGVCIEDKVFPKVNSFSTVHEQELETASRFASKIQAISDHRIDADFLVVARIEALIAGSSIEEALVRADLSAQAGADAIIIHSKKESAEEITSFTRLWGKRLPVIIIPTTYPTITFKEMQELSVSGVIYANQLLRASIHAMSSYLQSLDGLESLSDSRQTLATLQDVFDCQSMDEFEATERKYRQVEMEYDAICLRLRLTTDRTKAYVDINCC